MSCWDLYSRYSAASIRCMMENSHNVSGSNEFVVTLPKRVCPFGRSEEVRPTKSLRAMVKHGRAKTDEKGTVL